MAKVRHCLKKTGSGWPRGTTKRENRRTRRATVARHTASSSEIRAAVDSTVIPKTWLNPELNLGWISVVFSDESRFYLGTSDGQILVRRRPRERLQPNYLRPRQNVHTPGVMVWGATSHDSRRTLVCNNCINIAQRKHLDDFLRGRIIGQLVCEGTQLEVSEELGMAHSVISRLWQRFQNDGNVSTCYSTGLPRVTTPNVDRYIYIFGSYCQKKQTEHSIRPVSSAGFSYRYDQIRPCTDA
ncbi:uncharacterized protein TNCV_3291521 [Trichonephila clavipes]|nr:uncharacterized protein TNCV_3291521 [Trichonephila clavipes]